MKTNNYGETTTGPKILEEAPEEDDDLECRGCGNIVKAKNATLEDTGDIDPEEGHLPAHQPRENLWYCPHCTELLAIYNEEGSTKVFECPICGESHEESSYHGFDVFAYFCDEHTEEEIDDYIKSQVGKSQEKEVREELHD